MPDTNAPIPEAATEYPIATAGSTAAREMREECNNLTDAQREELLNEAMVLIYGSGAVAPQEDCA